MRPNIPLQLLLLGAGLVLLGSCRDQVTGPLDPGVDSPSLVRWSKASSWPGGRLPVAGEVVTIPKGQGVLLDVSPPPLGGLSIEGRLVFDDRDLNLTSRWITIHGTLRVGSEERPYRHRGVITLTGDASGEDVQGMGSKVLGVIRGALELHGERRVSWTRLDATAAKGTNQLVLEREPGWRPGERLVVASTDLEPAQTEEAVIRAVNGRTVVLEQPLRYTHWGERQTIAGRVVDQRAEVGLLSRNLVVRGDDGSVNGLGGHLMIGSESVARIEGVEFFRMGQKGRLARYPIHWHLAGDVVGQYARNNSIWRTFNRCLTVHGTNGLSVEDNVCYDHLGHGYFLEDGIETRNVLVGNLGVFGRAPAAGEAVLPSDTRPATFWITNPDNTFRGNVAAGSAGFGFWFALPEHPTGLSAPVGGSVWPRRTPLREFRDNVAHSNRLAGLQVDDGPRADGVTETTSYRPRQSPGAESPAVVADFRGLVAYKHRGQAVWLRGSSMRLTGAVLADNAIGVTFAASETFLEDALVVGETENRGTPLANNFPVRGFEFYDGRVGAKRVVFANFQPTPSRPASAIGFKRSNGFTFSTASYVEEVRFVGANPLYIENPKPDRDGDKNAVAWDVDGSLTGTPGAYVTANSPHLVTAGCTLRSEWNAYVCPNRFVDVSVRSATSEAVAPMEVRRDDGTAVSLVGIPNNPQSASLSGIPGRAYTLSFRSGPPSRLRLYASRLRAGEWIDLRFPYAGATVRVYREGEPSKPFTSVASVAELQAGAADRYHLDPATRVLSLRLFARTGSDRAAVYVDPQ